MNILFSRDLCAALVLTFGHFLWIGTVIAIVTSLLVRRQRTSLQRYGVWLTGFIVMACTPLITFAILQSIPSPKPSIPEPLQTVTTANPSMPPVDVAPANVTTSDQIETRPAINNPRGESSIGLRSASPDMSVAVPKAPEPTVVESDPAWWRDYAPLVTSLYLIGVALMALRLLVGLWGGHKLRYESELITERWMLDALQRQADALGLILVPAMAYCERVTVPTLLGILQPMILLPMTLASGLTPSQIESVLAHELAHLRRYDHLVNLLQCVIESILFFHPAVWWVSRRVRDEREHCCDDLVIAGGAVPLDYAASLLRVAELSRNAQQQVHNQRRSFTAASLFATGEQPSTLRQRIARLLGYQTDLHVRAIHPWVLFGLASCCVGVIWVLSSMTWNALADINRDHSLTTVVVEWSALVDESVMNEIRLLKNHSPQSTAETGTETIRCSAEELRSIINRRLHQPKVTTLGNRIEILRSKPGSRRNPQVVSWSFGDTIKNDDKGPNPVVGWNIHGKFWVEQDSNAVKLGGEADIGSSGSYLHITRAKIQFEEALTDGQAVTFAVSPTTSDSVHGFLPDQWKPTLIFVYEACEVPVNQVDLLKSMVSAKDWIRQGASELKEHLSRVEKWRSQANQEFATAHKPEWTHELPDGGMIELTGITRPHQARGIWWDPTGKPITGEDRSWGAPSSAELLGVVRVSEAGVERSPNISDKDVSKVQRIRESQFVAVPIKSSDSNGGKYTLKVGAGFGRWTAEGKVAPRENETASINGVTFRVSAIFDFPSSKHFHVHLNWEQAADTDVGIVAVRKDGTIVVPPQEPSIVSDDLGIPDAKGFVLPAPLKDIDHLLIQTRPRRWTEFTGFATEPAVALNPRLNFPKQHNVELPNGVSVEFVGLAANEEKPAQWWKPDGAPLSVIPTLSPEHRSTWKIGTDELRRALFTVRGLTDRTAISTNMSRTHVEEQLPSGEWVISWCGALQKNPQQKSAVVRVGIATEPLSPTRILDANGQRRPTADDAPVDHIAEDIAVKSVASRQGGRKDVAGQQESVTETELTYTTPVAWRQVDLRIVAIDRDGKQHRPSGAGGSLPTDATSKTPGTVNNIVMFALPPEQIDRFEYQFRLFRHWVTFENVAWNSGDHTNLIVTRDSIPAAKPQKYIASLPEGRSVEFVGITRNTAAAKEGWKPDGRPIGDVGYWPATNYISGNTHGTFTENGEHPAPNEGAIDLLFRFRGLKSQPSLTFDLATKGNSYSHLPLKEPYELRISTERRDPPPPGSHWTVPDGEMRVGLTDEPWGKWLQISPTGEILNPLTDDDLYRSHYEQVQIKRVEPHERAPNKLALVLRTPQGMSQTFTFEIRGIDPDEKSQWVLQWEGKGVEGTNLTEGRWGLATPETKPLTRFEFRLRPYRYWVTFTGVSVEPGQESDVTVKTELVNDNGTRTPGPSKETIPSTPIQKQIEPEIKINAVEPRPLTLQAEFERFSRQLRDIAPKNWSVERSERTFRLLSPEVTDGKLRREFDQQLPHDVVRRIPNRPDTSGLRLDATGITAKGLRELAGIENLVALYLVHVKDDELKEIAHFKKLHTLQIKNSDVTEQGLKQLAQLQSIRELSIPATSKHDAWIEAASKIENLVDLHITDELSDAGMMILGRMQNLKRLVLGRGRISDVGWEQIAKLRNLSELDLPQDLQLSSSNLKQLAQLQNLTMLKLNTTTLTDDGLRELAGLVNLKWLDLSNTRISDEGLKRIGGLGKLEALHIRSTGITDAGLKELANLRNLKEINLAENGISDAGVLELVGLKNVAIIDLSRTAITDIGLVSIAYFPNVTHLDIRDTRITGVGLKELSNLSRLTSLSIAWPQGRNQRTPTLQNISLLKSLTHLNVSGFAMSESVMKEIASLPNLTHLSLNGNITDSELRELASSTSIQSIIIDSRQITDPGLQSLANLGTLQELRIRRSRITPQGKIKLQEALPQCDLDVVDVGQFNDIPRVEI